MRLIDADVLICHLQTLQAVNSGDSIFCKDLEDIIDHIEELPTAYDIDKVVEQLEKVVTDEADLFATEEINYDSKGNLIIRSTTDLHYYALRCLDKAIEIVKSGGAADV